MYVHSTHIHACVCVYIYIYIHRALIYLVLIYLACPLLIYLACFSRT